MINPLATSGVVMECEAFACMEAARVHTDTDRQLGLTTTML